MNKEPGVIRNITAEDLNIVAEMEIRISKISFQEEAIVDKDFHIRKLRKSMDKDSSGMLVYERQGQVLGWLWMEIKSNFMTDEKYVNFKSFCVDDEIKGEREVEDLLAYGVAYAKKRKAKYIVGKVHVSNLAMRALYKNCGFAPTHLTMEMKL